MSITAIATIAFLLGHRGVQPGASNKTLNIIVIVLLVGAAVHTFVT